MGSCPSPAPSPRRFWPLPCPMLSHCTATVSRGQSYGRTSRFLPGGVLKQRGEGPGKQQGQQNAGQDLSSPWWDELRLPCLTKQPDQYVKEKEGRERVIRKKCYFPQFLFKFHGQSCHKWCGAHIFSIFVQEIAWPNSFCLQCVYCLKIQPLTWCSDIRQTLSMLILQL